MGSCPDTDIDSFIRDTLSHAAKVSNVRRVIWEIRLSKMVDLVLSNEVEKDILRRVHKTSVYVIGFI